MCSSAVNEGNWIEEIGGEKPLYISSGPHPSRAVRKFEADAFCDDGVEIQGGVKAI